MTIEELLQKFSVDQIDPDNIEDNFAHFYQTIEDREIEWVACLEEVAKNINCFLAHSGLNPDASPAHKADMRRENGLTVAFWSVAAVLHNGPLSKKAGLNVRSLKAGLKLTMSVARTTEQNVTNLLVLGCLDELFSWLRSKVTASTVKLAVVHCLDAITDWCGPMIEFSKQGWNGYARFV